jgi:3-hydroxyisobutyrate dehydrogenase-like beta-hydroxyacid dehydrogenase
MARRLVAGGLDTTVFDVTASAVDGLVAAGARRASCAGDVARAADVVGICVRDDADVNAVVHGADGLLAGASPGLVIAVHSTVLPSTVRAIGEAAAARGVAVVDACITGGAVGAEQGTLTYMVGGDAADLERCRPAFETCAEKIVHTGPLGSGTGVKLCNNLMTYLGFLAAFEATLLARRAGLSAQALEEVTRANGNMTTQMLAFLSLHRVPAAQRAEPGFQDLLRGFTTLAEKDLAVTLAFARENGVALPGAALCQQLMARVYGLDDENRR